MLHELQLGKLDLLMAQRPEDHQFANDVALVKQEVPADENHQAREARVEAENRVKAVVMKAGERVFHGDLLTFQKLTAARLVGAPCVRAIDRFEFLGPCRMQLFHLVMNMRGVDALAAMPDPAEFRSGRHVAGSKSDWAPQPAHVRGVANPCLRSLPRQRDVSPLYSL